MNNILEDIVEQAIALCVGTVPTETRQFVITCNKNTLKLIDKEIDSYINITKDKINNIKIKDYTLNGYRFEFKEDKTMKDGIYTVKKLINE